MGQSVREVLAHGCERVSGEPGAFRGSEVATAYTAGMLACIAESMPNAAPAELVKALQERALIPIPELGYAS